MSHVLNKTELKYLHAAFFESVINVLSTLDTDYNIFSLLYLDIVKKIALRGFEDPCK